jgi:hypothetical protein
MGQNKQSSTWWQSIATILSKHKMQLVTLTNIVPDIPPNTYSDGIFHVCNSRVELREMELRTEGNGKRQITRNQSGTDQRIFPVLVVG